jgi:Na+-transporting NADH:ubiquinone oxidoreductase subunit A
MAKEIKLRRGLDINLKGSANETKKIPASGETFAVCPDDFYGFKPKVIVHEGDEIKVGEPLFVNKQQEELKVVSPVSGKVVRILRGERRKVLSIEMASDGKFEAHCLDVKRPDEMDGAAVKALLLESGLFAFIKMRPYDITAIPSDTPKAIFISAFSKMPLSADFSFVVKGQEQDFLTGISALAKMAKVYIGICPEQEGADFTKTENAEVTIFDGPNPSGNVGVQINHLLPVNKGEVVWTIGAEEVIFIGRLFHLGHVDFTRTIALAGSEVEEPCYYEMCVGAPLATILTNLKQKEHIRIINGNPLVGQISSIEGHLGAHNTEVCVIPEGDDVHEVLGWILPRLKDYSTNRSYFSWLQGKRVYDLDARVKGGVRHMIMSGEYDKVFPMDIFAGYLIKAILVGDIDRMEQLGIYEVAPEDFAVAEFVDSSKLELQRIVREGLDMLRKEMA